MKKLVNAMAVAAIVVSAATASAQPEARDAGIFADAAGTLSKTTVAAFVPFNIYAIGFELDGQVKGYEFAHSGLTGLTILGATITGPAPLNFGDVPGEYIVGTGGCINGLGAFVMTILNVGSFTGANLTDRAVCITSTIPTSFPLVPGQTSGPGLPGYLQCDGTLLPFGVAQNGGGVYPNGCLILNPSIATDFPVANEAASFGEMKARF